MPGTIVQVDGQGSAQETSATVDVTPNEAAVVTAGSDQYWIRCLPPDFPRLTVVPPRDPAPAWYLTASTFSSSSFVMIFDERGTPVWYRRTSTPVIDARRLPDGNLAWMPLHPARLQPRPGARLPGPPARRHALTLIRAGGGLPTDYHDLVTLPNGNHIVLAYDEAARVAPLPFTCNDDAEPDRQRAPGGDARRRGGVVVVVEDAGRRSTRPRTRSATSRRPTP